MLSVNPWNLICIVLNLLILAALMKKFLYKPVLGIIEKRQNLIEEQMAQAKSCQEEAQQMKTKYENTLSEINADREQLMQKAKTEAGAEYERIVEDARKTAQQICSDAQQAGKEEKERAVRAAEKEIAHLAAAAAGRIVSQTSGKEADDQIYEDFLRKAGEQGGTDK